VSLSEDHQASLTTPLPVKTWVFVVVCASAGALAVPLHPVASPVSAGAAGLLGLLGLRVWRWSHLPSHMKTEAPDGVGRLVLPAASMGLGLIVGLVILGVIRLVIEPAVPAAGARIAAAAMLPLWRRGVIIYVAAVSEELLFRLVLLSLIAGVATRLVRRADRVPSRQVVWVANGLSAIAFAAAHLPAWRAVGPLSVGLALMVLTLNCLGGVVFGYVFVKRGILAAMWAHAGADCALLLIGPFTG
jgi:Type II CAAX prenyl endopeptidase Rce1-like